MSTLLTVMGVVAMVLGAVWFVVSAGALLIGRPAWPALKGMGNGFILAACGFGLYLFGTVD